jgi:hypothetical protein
LPLPIAGLSYIHLSPKEAANFEKDLAESLKKTSAAFFGIGIAIKLFAGAFVIP